MAIVKIGVMGAQGCGKTELVGRISRDAHGLPFPVAVVAEVARECPFAVNEKMVIEGQRWMFQEQIAREGACPDNAIVICDRTVVDPVVYSMWMADRNGDVMDWQMFVDARIPAMLNWYNTYDLVIWCTPSGHMRTRVDRLVDDGFRSVDLVFQDDISRLFDRVIGRYKLECVWPSDGYSSELLRDLVSKKLNHGKVRENGSCVRCFEGDSGNAA